MRPLFSLLLLIHWVIALPSNKGCSLGDECNTCTIQTALGSPCTDEPEKKPFYFCNPRTKKVDVDQSSYLTCKGKTWSQESCSPDGRTHFSLTNFECIDPSTQVFYAAQGTSAYSGSGRISETCSFNTDCLGGMLCSIGQCRCLSTYVAVDSYCYEKISPSESGCFYDVQCNSVWPDSFCKNGMCVCPNEDMIAVKTKDGTLCVWQSSSEPSCPLPSLPPPESPAALVVLPAVAGKSAVSIAACNPHSNSIPQTEEALHSNSHEHKCAVRGIVGEQPSPIDVSDVYDCIDNSKFWKEQGKKVTNHPLGVCCMNRAFTCMQPKKGESDALGSVPRWWFNSVVGSCQQFLFDPTSSDVSPNNFETLDHCESYCKDTCPRGNPAYLTSKSQLGMSPHVGCTTTHPCPDPFQCTDVASQSMCCPSRKSLCSDAGGRLKDPKRTTPYDAGMRFDQLTGESANYAMGISTRYYYNPTDGQCHPFTYNGFLGTFNNFHNQADCQIFCARLQCTHGSPLTNGNGAPQRCQRDTDCPSTHSCSTEHSVCCPSPQTLCTEPLRVGDCKQSVRQFWYNAETRTCEAFQYTGCQGNNNRFASLNECQSYCKNINAEPKCPQGRAYIDFSGKYMQCGEGLGGNTCPANYECTFDGLVHGCCPSKAYTCSLQMHKGVACGSGSSYRFYYNNQMKECQSFLFLGCDGNSNNFATSEKCQSFCEIAVCPNGGSPLRANSKVRTCSSTEPCPSGYECSMVEANGVTQRRCCPTKVAICSKPPAMGILPKCSGSSGQTKYYFNMALQSCSSYTSNGCDTSMNSFGSMAECEDFCFSAGCTAGDTVYKDPNSNKPFICKNENLNNCPANFQCTLNALTQEHVCCGSDSHGVCPTGEKAYIDPRNNSPRQCAMAADGKCPGGYLCRFSQNNNKYYCCGSITGAMCPVGRSLFRFTSTQLPLQCHISAAVSNPCPPTFACLSEVPHAFQGFCCSQHPICPHGSAFHLDEKSQMPTTCSSEGFAFCPQGYTCQQQPETNNFFCCAGAHPEGVNDGCPPNQFAHILDGSVKSCDPFNVQDTNCPSDYTCQWSLKNQKYQCCGTRPIRQTKPHTIDDGCPARQFALVSRGGKPRVCTAGEEKSCPIGFFCQFSAKKAQFQCCGQSGGCPTGRAAYIAVDGNAQECLPGPDMCSDGYECVKSIYLEGKNICCSKEESGCAENEELINGECMVRVKPEGSCHKSEECGGGSSCIDNTCTCPPEQLIINGACTKKECSSDQIRIEGVCTDRADIGQACKSSLQCVANSRCISGRCDCSKGEMVKGNKCVKQEATTVESATNRQGVCPTMSHMPYYEKGTTRMRYCSQIADDCPSGFTCQYSDQVKQNICCGEEEEMATAAPKKSKGRSSNHCPAGMSPYLLNGRPKSCATGSCPIGFQCKFSNGRKDYFCCTKNPKKSSSDSFHMQGGGCPRGSALLFPTTKEPVSCNPESRACPHGYLCMSHTTKKHFQCCSVEAVRDMAGEVEITCPSYLVKVDRIVNGERKPFCVKNCPADLIKIDGVCAPRKT